MQARPATQLYRFRRMVRRNKLAFTATAAVIVALITGLSVSTWMFFKEKHARQRAVAAEQEQGRLRQLAEAQEKKATSEASKSRQVARFLKDMLNGVGPSVALGRDTKMLREILDKTAERVGKDLKDQPDVEADLRNIIGVVYFALGEWAKAVAMGSEALRIRRTLFGNEHLKVADSLNNLASTLAQQEATFAEAEAMFREALAIQRKLRGNEHADMATALNNLGLVLGSQGKLPEAESLHREALVMRKKLLGEDHSDVGQSLHNLAMVLGAQGKSAEAGASAWEGLALWRKLFGNVHPAVAQSLNNIANGLAGSNRLAEAEAMHREALAIRRTLFGDHPRVIVSLDSVSRVLFARGKLSEAETMLREALAMRRKLLGEGHAEVVVSLNNLANVLVSQDKLAEAEPVRREILEITRKSAPKDLPSLDKALRELAENLYRQNKYAEAEPLYREVVGNQTAGGTGDLVVGDVASAIASLGRLLADWAWAERGPKSEIHDPKPEATKRAREAERLLREALAMRLSGTDPSHWRTDDTRSRLGGALLSVAVTEFAPMSDGQLAKFAEAEALLLAGNEALQQSPLAETKYKRDALIRLIRLSEAWDKPDKAAEWKQKLANFDETKAKPVTREETVAPEP